MNSVHTVTASEYEAAVGNAPVDDDLERVNCKNAGEMGHDYCGWCPKCNKPRFICGHVHRLYTSRIETLAHKSDEQKVQP